MLLKTTIEILKSHQQALSQHGVRSLAIFGSTARNEANESSDVDILVDFDAKKGLFAFVGLKDYLEQVLGCKVDLVTEKALHPRLKTQILHEAKNVF